MLDFKYLFGYNVLMNKFPNGHILGDCLRRMRKNAQLTQAEVADIIGVSRISIIRWEAGLRTPSFAALCAFVEACNCELSEVVAG